MNDKALRVILVVDVVAASIWALALSLFVDWATAWTIAAGSFVYLAVVFALVYQFGEVQAAAAKAKLADADQDSDVEPDGGTPYRGVQ